MLQRWDMRLTDRAVLVAIAANNGKSQEALAATLDCNRKTIERALRRLVIKGVISRQGTGGSVPYTYVIHRERLPDDIKEVIQI